jgi:hypothetical protein
MNEELVRSLVRETIARHLGALSAVERAPLKPASFYRHASHYRYALPESGGPCAIEPGVRCTHCGYCESHGH